MINDELSSRVRLLHLRSRKLVESLFAGNYHSVFKGPGLEFDEVREYEYGDDVRFIDWNVSSRMGSPYSKVFREERELTLFMVVDVSASLTLGDSQHSKRDTAGSLFALLSLAALANNDKVGSLLFTDKVERLVAPTGGLHSVLRQVKDVLGYNARGRGSNLGDALISTAQTLRRRSIIVIISDFRTVDYHKPLKLLARKHDVIAIRITDPLDKKLPHLGLVELEDPESGESFTTWGRSTSMNQNYAEFWNEQHLNWIDICRSAGADILEVSSHEEPADSLLSFFHRRRGV